MPVIITEQSHQSVATPAHRFNSYYVYLISTVIAMGGLLFGFDLSIISGTVRFFSGHYHLDEIGTGWAVGCINVGAALGALVAGKLSDVLGRRKVLLMCALLFALTGIGTGWAETFTFFIVFRILSGVAVGMAAMVCPMYIAEISPAALRGKLVSCYQLAITLGILLAYISNYLLLNTGANNWRWMFSTQSAPAVLFFLGLLFVGESPRWLIRKNRLKEAEKVLIHIGGPLYAQQESEVIRKSFSSEIREDVRELLDKKILYILFIGVLIAFFSQADGQNSLFSYSPEIFRMAGMMEDSAFLQSVILGLVNFVFTFLAIFAIDRVGRKRLLMYGAVLLFLDALILAFAFYFQLPGTVILYLVLAFIAIYAASLGPVTWVALSELFPNRVRGNAMSVATLSLWISNFITTASFPIMKVHFGLPVTFGIHALICLVYFFFVLIAVPETKGKSLEEIEQILTK